MNRTATVSTVLMTHALVVAAFVAARFCRN